MRKLTMMGLSALALVAMGCDDERTSTLDPVGPIAIGAPIGPAAAGIPGGTITATAPVRMVLANLRQATGQTYHFWYVSQNASGVDVYTPAFSTILERFRRDSLSAGTTGTPVPDPVTGETIRVVDTNVVSATRTGSYAGTDDANVFEIIVVLDSAADVGTTTPATGRNAAVVSLGAGTAADNMFLFRRYGVAGGGALSFGNFGGSDLINATAPTDYIYTIGGTGVMNFRGGEFVADFRELRRPPRGFFYRGFLVDTSGAVLLVDTLASQYDALPSISRVSLYDADVNGQLPGIAVDAIATAEIRNCASGSGVNACQSTLALPATNTFGGQATFILNLVPKGAANTFVNTVVLSGSVPDRVWTN